MINVITILLTRGQREKFVTKKSLIYSHEEIFATLSTKGYILNLVFLCLQKHKEELAEHS